MYQAGRTRPPSMSLDEMLGCQLAVHFPIRVPLEVVGARRFRLAREAERRFA
jgi:hypothetical protein